MKYWKTLSAKINQFNRRERLLILVAILATIWIVSNYLLLNKPLAQQKKLQNQLSTEQKELTMLQQQLSVLQSTPIIDPDQESRNKLDALQQQQQTLAAQLKTLQNAFISPEQMASTLKDILQANSKLKLNSLKTLDVSEIDISPPAASPAGSEQVEKTLLYKHGIELSVTGRYFDLQEYLASLEKLPWHLMWGKVELTSQQHPDSTLSVTLYTLSLDKTWLSL